MTTWDDVLKISTTGNPRPPSRIEKTAEQWKELLPADVYEITRKKGTEHAFTGAYCEAHDPGLYACRCCSTLLFDSNLKFESGTGWPSFTQPHHPDVIAYHGDSSFAMTRVEVTCNVCDAHLGHVFPDGPKPGGLRYCINSAAIQLVDQPKS
ncbi:MAG: peptide-methionine (R)-S-oxide reductase MsrB [Cytophagales bacterium]|nr:peptide-methionine (R)-S-oxide reductase MsrB [Cytophagales bacterium]